MPRQGDWGHTGKHWGLGEEAEGEGECGQESLLLLLEEWMGEEEQTVLGIG